MYPTWFWADLVEAVLFIAYLVYILKNQVTQISLSVRFKLWSFGAALCLRPVLVWIMQYKWSSDYAIGYILIFDQWMIHIVFYYVVYQVKLY